MNEKQCRITGAPFEVSQREEDLYALFDADVPDISPQERLRLLLSFQNGHNYFWRKCSVTGDSLYSVFGTERSFEVLEPELWKEKRENGDFFEHGIDWNSRVQFFEQLAVLFSSVPRPSVHTELTEKILGCTEIFAGERLSFVSSSARVNDIFTSSFVHDSNRVGDSLEVSRSDECYNCIDVHGSTRVLFAQTSRNCRDSLFLTNCQDCDHCLFCSYLKGKSYHIENAPVTPEEYEKQLAGLNLRTRSGREEALERFSRQAIKDVAVSNVTSDCVNVLWTFKGADCVDLIGFSESIKESALSVACGGGARRIFASVFCWGDVEEILYSAYCTRSRELIGCFGLENVEHCIFNKQYPKKEYFELKEQIISAMKKKKSWGRPLGFRFADFPYNHSFAQDFFPLTKVQSSLLEVEWDEQFDLPHPSKLLASDESLARLAEPVSSLEQALQQPGAIYLCEFSGTAFQYFPAELELCSKLGICPSPYAFGERYRQQLQRIQYIRK